MSIYAVNGKTPVAAWIPSRDTAGNGTTTLNDLVGTNHGTLTNMDAATDWVADTANGGIRALDFDGVNDFVRISGSLIASGAFSVSGWFLASSFSVTQNIWSRGTSALGTYMAIRTNTTPRIFFTVDGVLTTSIGTTALATNTWYFFALVRSGNNVLYLNSTIEASSSTTPDYTADNNTLSSTPIAAGLQFLTGRIDDVRIFNTALNASDVAQLYRNGNGRGVTANSNTFQIGMPI
jgi:hypothetical protein